jgi:type II secretory pathway pseudopilin PulG
MNDAIVGVIVGALLASVVPLVTLIIQQRRWRLEKKLEFLRSERRRMEELFDQSLKRIVDGMNEDSYSSELYADSLTLLPEEILNRFIVWIKNKAKDQDSARVAYTDIAVLMKKHLAKIDEEIKSLVMG